jgi:hypothetical protein
VAEDKEVLVDHSNPDKKLRIGTNLRAKWKLTLVQVPREVIEHKLGIDPSFKLIKQKERRYIAKRRETIQQEVNRLLEAGFIRPVDYPSWLANPALVEKPDGS